MYVFLIISLSSFIFYRVKDLQKQIEDLNKKKGN